MKSEVQAFFADQNAKMTLVEEDFHEFLALRSSPVTSKLQKHGNDASSSSAAGTTSSIHSADAPMPPVIPQDVTASLPRNGGPERSEISNNSAKRPGTPSISSPARKKTKVNSTVGVSNTLPDVTVSPRAARLHARHKQQGAAVSLPAAPPLSPRPLEATSSIEEIPGPSARPAVKSPKKLQSRQPTSKALGVGGTSKRPSLRAAESSSLQIEVASRVAKLATKRSQPRLVKVGGSSPSHADRSAISISSVSSPASSRPSSPSPDAPRARVQPPPPKVPVTTKKPLTKAAAKKASGKAVKIKLTPEKFARQLLEKQAAKSASATSTTSSGKLVAQFLRNKNIFYCGGEHDTASETTMQRMELLVKYGANLQPTYDPAVVSQIIVGDRVPIDVLVSKIGLKSWGEIPHRVPTLKWNWVGAVIGSANRVKDPNREIKQAEYYREAAYLERYEAGDPKKDPALQGELDLKKKKKAAAVGKGASRILSFRVDRPQDDFDSGDEEEDHVPAPVPGPAASSSSKVKGGSGKTITGIKPDDPLAEFYAQAAAEHHEHDQWARHGEVDDTSDAGSDGELEPEPEPEPQPDAKKRRGFACDVTGAQPRTCVNQDIVNKLSELMELHRAKPGEDDKWRVLTYSKAIRALLSYPTRIKTYSQAVSIRGIGKKTAEKILEILSTGDLRRIGHENTEDVKVTRLFQGIYGVGQTTAIQWYSNGARTLDDLRNGKGGIKLKEAQRIGLENYDDINSRMPRDEAKALFELIQPIALNIDPNLFVEIMGSYRRGKADCGDIDIMITRCPRDGHDHGGILATLLQKLHDVGILTDDLALPENPWDLEAIYRGLCRLPKEGSRKRRIDFLTVPWESKGAALLYYTGDDIFNRAMRLKARHRGYALNQKGLFEGVVRDPRNRAIKLNKGTLLASETEEEIFKILEVPYQAPHERVRNFD